MRNVMAGNDAGYGWLAGAEDFICKMADEAVAPWRQRETVPWSAWKTLKLKADNTVEYSGTVEPLFFLLKKGWRLGLCMCDSFIDFGGVLES